MNATKLFVVTLLTAVTGAAFAGQESVQIRGEGYNTPSGQFSFDTARSSLTRADVRADVTRARAEGMLMAAGEAPSWTDQPRYGAPSNLARAEIKAQVLQARREGTLIPAGEAYASFSGSRPIGNPSFAQARVNR